MSSADFLNQDFGSESEDDNFNPAPAGDSDNDAAGDSDGELNVTTKVNGTSQRKRPLGQRNAGEEDEDIKDDGIEDADGVGDEDDDEDEEEEDEDEEEAISVRGFTTIVVRPKADVQDRVGRESELVEIPGINSSMLKP